MRVGVDERLDMRKGREVEVCYEDKEVWYKAIIGETAPTKSNSDSISVRLLKDDFATPLTQLSENVLIRPVPPHHLEARLDIKEGCVVDAYHKDGWWTGFVIKEMEDNKKFLVFFDSPLDIILFDRKVLRPHLKWVNKKCWVIPGPDLLLLRRLTEDSKFSSGAMVEVSSEIDNMEVVWVPAMVIIETEEKKCVVKFCNKPLNCQGNKAKPNVTVDLQSVRPKPPPVLVQDYKLLDCVEAFHSSRWRKGIVKRVISHKWYMVSFEATKKQLRFNHSDLRLPMEWEDGVWKSKESPLAQGSVMNGGNTPSLANESVSPVTSTPVIISTPLTHAEADTREKTSDEKTLEPMMYQNGLGNELTRDKMPEEPNSEDNSRKRKRGEIEHNSDLNETVPLSDRTPNAEKNFADATMVLPFVKKSPVWKTYESMEVFKRLPQSPHFSPLVETKEDFREGFALGMMVTFSGVLEKVKDLNADVPTSQLNSLKDSFAELEKHGFTVTEPLSRINKLLALKDRQVNILEKLKGFKEEMTDGCSKKRKAEQEISEMEDKILEVKHKILELQRQEAALRKDKDSTYKMICEMESRERELGVELEDVEFEFETILSAPW